MRFTKLTAGVPKPFLILGVMLISAFVITLLLYALVDLDSLGESRLQQLLILFAGLLGLHFALYALFRAYRLGWKQFRRTPVGCATTATAMITIITVVGSLGVYRFVRDRAEEFDSTFSLPRLWQIGDDDSDGASSGGETVEDLRYEYTVEDVLATYPGLAELGNIDPSQMDGAQPFVFSPPPLDESPSGPAADQSVPGETTPDTDESALLADGGEPDAPDSATAQTDPRRKTVLLLGIDQRAGEEGSFPTDTIILFSVDPVGKTAAILSIPRDLWVDFPGFTQLGRINTANILGEEVNFPGGGGPALATKTVERMLGLNNKIDYYFLINFEVFTTVIDAVGPIEVCPSETIHDDQYPDGSYGYITVHFDPGCQELDSERLLQYARVRHTDSDIARSNRQQEVILAVRKKVLTMGGVMALLPEAPGLWESMQDNIRTNMTFEELVDLGRMAEGIPADNIRQGQITYAEVEISTTPEGDEILVPIGTDIRLLIEDLFRPPGTPSSRE